MNIATFSCRAELEAVFSKVGEILQAAAERVAAGNPQWTADNSEESCFKPVIHLLGEADGGPYGNHYNVVWILTDEAWHPSEAELPEEFTITGTLLQNVSNAFAESITHQANQECDLLGRRGRWAIVIPAGLI